MASWDHCFEVQKKLESHVLLELKALGEGTWKMAKFMVFSHRLVLQVTLELHILFKVASKAYPELQAMLIDVQQYKTTWIVGGASAAL